MPRAQKPFDKIFLMRSKLGLYVEHGDAALQGQPFSEFIVELRECFDHLVDLRNIINGIVSLEQTPGLAALNYINEADVREVFGEPA